MSDAADQPAPDEEEVVDAEVVDEGDEKPGQALAPIGAGGPAEVATLWNTRSPAAIIKQASDVATALADIIEKQDLSVNLGGKKKHVEIAGWQVCGTFLGVQALTTGTSRVEPRSKFEVKAKRKKWGMLNGKRQIVEETDHVWTVEGWSFDAVAEARTLDGRVVGRGEATCSREESNWFDSEDSAVKSMAQTRACSRALKQTLGFIVGMAGYSETPREEMDATGAKPVGGLDWPVATEKQRTTLSNALLWLIPEDGQAEAAWETIKAACGGELYGPVADALIASIGWRKKLDEKPAAEDKPPEGAPPETAEPS